MAIAGGKVLPRIALCVVAIAALCGGVYAQSGSVPAGFDSWDPNGLYKAGQFVVGKSVHNGKSIEAIVVPGRPPVGYRAPLADPVPANATAGIVILPSVPAFDWCYGCSATSAAMIMGYYDNTGFANMYTGPTNSGICPMTNATWGSGECPLSATHEGYDGLTVRGHVDDYWREYGDCENDPWIGNWTQHTYADCTADYMGTNQSARGSCDGSTTFWYYTDGSPLDDYSEYGPDSSDGCHGMRLFVESRGYDVTSNFSQYILGYEGNTLGFTYDQYKAEIDAGRPVLIQVSGHTMVGCGYNTSGSLVYLHDTWDYGQHQMTWGSTYSGMQHYAVTTLALSPIDSGDAYEPDNSPAEARILLPGVTQVHSIKPVGDQDWLTFTLDGESEIVLETAGVADGDTRMWLYDAQLNQIDYDDDSGTDAYSLIDRACDVDALPAGTYYVRIEDYDNDGVISSYNINLTVGPCGEVCSPDVPKAIEDGFTTCSDLEITNSVSITDVNVRLNIEHSFDADLEVALMHPDGTLVKLFSNVGTSGDNFTDTVLDDSALTDIANGWAPFTGSYRPERALSTLNGKDSVGIWQLLVNDTYAGDTGTLISWCLVVSGLGCKAPTITEQPWAMIRCEGESARFNVVADGPGPLRYQWRRGGSNIEGATLPNYEIGSVTAADSGDYDCVVSNDCNSVVSETTWLEAGTCMTIADAKAMPDGERVVMRDTTTSAGLLNQTRTYLEQTDRASGISCDLSPDSTNWSGRPVEIVGYLATNDDGERYLSFQAAIIYWVQRTIAPIGMPNRNLGGADWKYDPETGAGQRGVVNGFGLNNIGLLVRTWGVVQSLNAEDNSYTITDGSVAPLTVKLQSGETLPGVLETVSVTGISSCLNVDGQILPVLLALPEDLAE